MAGAVRGSYTFVAEKLMLAPFEQFGYYKGGTISLDAQYVPGGTQAPVYLIACALQDVETLLTQYGDIRSLCGDGPTSPVNFESFCSWSARLSPGTNTSVSYRGVADKDDFWEFMYLNCDGDATAEVATTFNFVNPGGENLSSAYVPFKSLTTAFVGVWGGLVALWAANWACCHRRSTPLHRIMGLVPILHCASNLDMMMYWRDLSRTGDDSVSGYLLVLLSSGCSTAALLSVLVLVSKGYNITRPTLLSAEWRSILVMATIFVVSYFTWQLITGFFFLFLLILVYVLVLRYLFASVSANLRLIQFQLRFVTPAARGSDSLPARQLAVVRRFRSALTVYMGLDIMLHVWSMMTLQRSPWAEFLLVEVCTQTLVLYLLVAFRLQRRSPYFAPFEELVRPLMADGEAGGPGEGSGLLGSVFGPGHGSAGGGSGALAGGGPTPMGNVVIIQNPSSTDASGKVVHNVSLGTGFEGDGDGDGASASATSSGAAATDSTVVDVTATGGARGGRDDGGDAGGATGGDSGGGGDGQGDRYVLY